MLHQHYINMNHAKIFLYAENLRFIIQHFFRQKQFMQNYLSLPFFFINQSFLFFHSKKLTTLENSAKSKEKHHCNTLRNYVITIEIIFQ